MRILISHQLLHQWRRLKIQLHIFVSSLLMSSQVERFIETMRTHYLPDILSRNLVQTVRPLADKISKVNIEKKKIIKNCFALVQHIK